MQLSIDFDYRIYRAAALFWMAIIFFLSSQPSLPVPGMFSGQDKLMHFIFYGVLGLFIARGLSPWRGELSWAQIGLATLLVALYGASDEFHQSFVPGRSPSVGDLIADTLGGFFAAWLFKGRTKKI